MNIANFLPRTKTDSPVLEKGLRYWAFLSYRSSDKKQAAWLHRRLEAYRVPWRMVGRPGAQGAIPRRISPIFRDRDDARGAEDLETIIAHELSKSKHLIVLCTPSAAEKEAWVGREIELFRERRPGAPIHAVIGKGMPPSCFPEQLLSRDQEGRLIQPLAPDLRPVREGGDGKNKVVIKLITGLIEVDFDELWQRERRRRAIHLAFALIIALAVASGGYQWFLTTERNKTALQLVGDAQPILSGERPGGLTRGLLKLLAAYRMAKLPETEGALSAPVKTMRVWDVNNPDRGRVIETEHAGPINSATYSPDGKRIVAGSWDRTLSIWDADTYTRINTLVNGHKDAINSVAFSHDGSRIVSGGEDGTVSIWDSRAGQPPISLIGRHGPVRSVAFSPDDKLVAAGNFDNAIILW